MVNWIQNAVSQWENEKVKLLPYTTINNILKAEEFLGYQFPEDFKQFYLKVNGFVDYDWQTDMFSIWSLDRIVAEFDNSLDNEFIGFCDWLICSHVLGFSKSKTGVYKNYLRPQELEIVFVADSFEQAINLINTHSELLY